MPSELPPALRALIDVGGALFGRSATGRVLLGRIAGAAAPAALPWIEPRLQQAREEASAPLSARAVERALRETWRRPPGRVLDALDLDAPVACTPLGQVHRAERDGRPVAVKVRRPGLEGTVRADLALLDGLRPPLAALLPGVDPGALLAQIRERALDELDLEHEGAMQRAARRALRTPGVEIPAVHSELSGPAVLVSEWLDGPTLAAQRPGDRAAVADALVQAHAQVTRAGLVMCDPRPNHVVLRPDGGAIGLLGTGAAVGIDRDRGARLLGLLEALREPDASHAVDDAGALGLPAADARAAHGLAREVLGDPVRGSAPLDRAALVAAGERALARAGDLVAVAGVLRPAPGDLWLGRMAAQLAAVLAGLGAREDPLG